MGEIISHGWAGRGVAGLGVAWRGWAGLGKHESHGREQWHKFPTAGQGMARRGAARLGKARQLREPRAETVANPNPSAR